MAAPTDVALNLAPTRGMFEEVERQRRALWDRLLVLFRYSRPTTDDLTEISLLANLALDQVFDAYKFTDSERAGAWEESKDFAECAALYGYVLGVDVGRKRAEAAGTAQGGD